MILGRDEAAIFAYGFLLAFMTVGLMIAYIMGFLIATAGLHVVGALIGMTAVRKDRGEIFLRLSGALIAVMGVFLLVNA